MKLFILVTRLLLGGLFVGHGAQKVFGWFGGFGPDGTGGWLESLGVKPGRQHAMAAGASEMAGGALLALGLATPAAGAAITGVMTTAIRTVHQPNGPWVTDNGWEYPAVVIATVLTVVELGPGPRVARRRARATSAAATDGRWPRSSPASAARRCCCATGSAPLQRPRAPARASAARRPAARRARPARRR